MAPLVRRYGGLRRHQTCGAEPSDDVRRDDRSAWEVPSLPLMKFMGGKGGLS